VSPKTEHAIESSIPARQPKSFGMVYWWIALVVLLGGCFATWGNHFGNGFHQDDKHVIVENPVIRSASVGRVWGSARAASSLAQHVAWRPLSMLTWMEDYSIQGPSPAIFHADSFMWFLWVLVWIYALARLTPDSSRYSALLAVSLVAFHPLTADLLNYISHRYLILRALGITVALVLFDAWPRRMPPSIWFEVRRIPRNEFDLLVRRIRIVTSKAWKFLLAHPFPWYFVPLVLGLLSDPGTAVFPLILIAWIRLFNPERSVRDVRPSAMLCGLWWLVHTALTLAPTAPVRQPAFAWWWTQPSVAIRYLLHFFYPVGLEPVSNLRVIGTPFSIEAIGGIIGVGALIVLAIAAARTTQFKVAAFGLSWFLIALVPDFLVPQVEVEDLSRAFVPMIGLSIGVAGMFWLGVSWFRRSESSHAWAGVGVMGAAAGAGLVFLGVTANERNPMWQSEDRLWAEVLEMSPSNPQALLNRGRSLLIGGQTDEGFAAMEKARVQEPKNPQIELALATLAESGGSNNAEDHFKRALTLAPWSSAIMAAYSDWLLSKGRNKEALDLANKAVSLDPYSAPGRRAVMNVELANRDWREAAAFGMRTLGLLPADPDALRAINVATSALDEISQSEKRAKTDPTVENYLQLSISEMQNGHFEDGIEACREALKIQPNLAEAWSNISVGYHMLGKTDESIAALQEAIRLRPDLPNLKENLQAELAAKAAHDARLAAPN
jgi:tetratricopeptide (TPR) repeat protein